jgi:uncharacterized protein (TIGR02246 family)
MNDRDIRSRIDALNDAWQAGRFDDLGGYFHEDARLVAPGFASQVSGRDAIVGTYRDFAASARIDEFRLDPANIERWGDTAVATSVFNMTYTFSGATYTESGHDILVLARHDGEWIVVWRTVVAVES